MRVVVISAWGATHAAICRSLHEYGHDVRVLHLHPEPPPHRPSLLRRVAAHPWQSLSSRVREFVLGVHLRRIERACAQALFAGEVPGPAELGLPSAVYPTWARHDAQVLDTVRSWEPACVLTTGAPMLRAKLYKLAPVALNLHWGIAPQYRGGHTLFWALHNRDRAGVGYTLHHLASGSDTGRIVHQARVDVDLRAGEAACWIACARAASEGVPRVIGAAGEGRTQDGPAHLYRYADRTLLAQARYAWARLWRGGRAFD